MIFLQFSMGLCLTAMMLGGCRDCRPHREGWLGDGLRARAADAPSFGAMPLLLLRRCRFEALRGILEGAENASECLTVSLVGRGFGVAWVAAVEVARYASNPRVVADEGGCFVIAYLTGANRREVAVQSGACERRNSARDLQPV